MINNIMGATGDHNQVNHGLIFVYGNTGTGKTYSMGLLNTLTPES